MFAPSQIQLPGQEHALPSPDSRGPGITHAPLDQYTAMLHTDAVAYALVCPLQVPYWILIFVPHWSPGSAPAQVMQAPGDRPEARKHLELSTNQMNPKIGRAWWHTPVSSEPGNLEVQTEDLEFKASLCLRTKQTNK